MLRPDTTMFRVKYIGDNGALQNTKGWAWCEARQPGLTFLKWMYSVDNDPEATVWTVVGPIELEFERNWSRKKDREIDALPIHSMRFAAGLVKDPYLASELRKKLNISEPEKKQEVLDLNALYAQHDSADEIRAERAARDVKYERLRAEAMGKIDSILGADLDPEGEEVVDLEWDDESVARGFEAKFQETVQGTQLTWTPTTYEQIMAKLGEPLPIQADEDVEVVDLSCFDLPSKTRKESSALIVAASSKSVSVSPNVSNPKQKNKRKKSTVNTTPPQVEIVDLFLSDETEQEVVDLEL